MNYDLSDLSIFIVDDSRFTQDIVASLLRSMRIHHIKAFDAPIKAIETARSDHPDLMIVDYMMHDIDGREATRLIRASPDERLAFMPIIVLTAYTEEWRIVAARDAGATEIVAKPVSVRALYRALVQIIEHPRPFVRTTGYFGPDRRRRMRPFTGDDRRREPIDFSSSHADTTADAPRQSGTEHG
jgi:CheY-like chemotaxis protein